MAGQFEHGNGPSAVIGIAGSFINSRAIIVVEGHCCMWLVSELVSEALTCCFSNYDSSFKRTKRTK